MSLMRKFCVMCGSEFLRPPTGMRDRDWARRIYCDKDCSRIAEEAKREKAVKPVEETPAVKRIADPCGALNRACWDIYTREAEQRGMSVGEAMVIVGGMRA